MMEGLPHRHDVEQSHLVRGLACHDPTHCLRSFLLLPLLGCGVESARESAHGYAAKSEMSYGEPSAPPAGLKPARANKVLAFDAAPSAIPAAGMLGGMAGEAAQKATDKLALSRKIIYDAQVDLVVKDVDATAKQVVEFVQSAGGYIAEQGVTGSPGAQRSMKWKLRVPVDQFESLVQKIVGLGELVQNSRTSQDVTEQFYDIEARIKNKKAEEKSLMKILDERTGKLEDVLKIETELSRVRGEIEQLEGKIRVLENLSSLATLALSIREAREVRAPAADRGRLSDPGGPNLGEVAPRPHRHGQGHRALGRGLGSLDPLPDRRRARRLDHLALALAALASPDRPCQHADHSAAGSIGSLVDGR